MAESEAFELEHRGTVHRAADFDVLLKWAEDLRIDSSDRFRPAGSDDWKPVMQDSRLKTLLAPENHWRVRMSSGEFTAGSFETIAKWAREGRLSTDAVVEGPRTPPGGVMASALPALSAHLLEAETATGDLPRLMIDGRVYPAPDVETISRWISESRVPLEAQISLANGPWEPVGSCGLFDLENWPQAALGDAGEQHDQIPERVFVPEPLPQVSPPAEAVPAGSVLPGIIAPAAAMGELPEYSGRGVPVDDDNAPEPEKFQVITGSGVEYSCVDPSEILVLLRKRKVMEYDEVRHSSLPDGSVSVGALVDLVRKKKRGMGVAWRITAVVVLAAAGVYLADTLGWIAVPWLP